MNKDRWRCKLKLKFNRILIIGSVYGPPDYAVFWLGVDFNLLDIDWRNQDTIGNKYSAEIDTLFLEMSQDLGLQQIFTFPS